MEKWSLLFILLVAIFSQNVVSKTEFQWSQIRIDCGASNISMPYKGWQLDSDYIKSGLNHNLTTTITAPTAISYPQMRNLRSFPSGDKNCYKFYLYTPNKYIVRAGFYYGNYDGLSKPPIFDLAINGEFWTRITSSFDEVKYEEVLYPTRESEFELCLVRIGDDVPFISSIEAASLLDGSDRMYRLMNNDSALYLQSRLSFGGKGDDVGIETSQDSADIYDRIWKHQTMSDYENITSSSTPYGTVRDLENEPPARLLSTAITPKNNSKTSNTSISLSIPVPRAPSPSYFVFYFKEPVVYVYPPITHIRRIKIYIDGHEMGITEVPQNYTGQVVSYFPVTVLGPAVNITLVEAEGSTYPPILNGLEVFASKEISDAGYSCYPSFVQLLAFHVFVVSLMLFG